MEIICYACGRGENPENTLEAIAHCQQVNPDWRMEMDVQITKDGELILFHDENAMRTTGADLEIASASMDEIEQLNAGESFDGAKESSYRVPRLKEVFTQFPNARLLLDVHTPDLRAVDAILDLIDEHKPKDLAIASEFDHIIAAFRNKAPNLTYGAATKEAKKLIYSSFMMLDALFALKGDILIIPNKFGKITVLTPRIVRHVQKRGRKLWAWEEEGESVVTVNSVEEINDMERKGVNAIFTEFPGRIKEQMANKA